jgi:hypothetical protein
MLPEGKHVARATGQHEWGQSDKGTDFLWLQFKLKGAEDETIGAYLYFSEAAAARSIESLRHCGCTFPDNDVTNLDGLTSRDVQLVIEHEEWDGAMRAKVKWINALAGVREEQKMSPAAKAGFKQRMKGALLASKSSAPPSDGAGPSSPAKDSDIPF